jgi:polyhydroxyalkanoate synthesis regulator phasin
VSFEEYDAGKFENIIEVRKKLVKVVDLTDESLKIMVSNLSTVNYESEFGVLKDIKARLNDALDELGNTVIEIKEDINRLRKNVLERVGLWGKNLWIKLNIFHRVRDAFHRTKNFLKWLEKFTSIANVILNSLSSAGVPGAHALSEIKDAIKLLFKMVGAAGKKDQK